MKIAPFGHLWLKVCSVVLAVLLWVIVSGEQVAERALRVPLEFQQVPAGLELTGDVPSTVDVHLRGPSGALGRLAPGDVVTVLDAKTAQPGRHVFQLTPEQVRVPFGVQVLHIAPATLTSLFERVASRQVPIVVRIEGKPADGYVVQTITVDPSQIEIVGPETAVKRSPGAQTEPLSIEGVKEAASATLGVGPLDSALRLKAGREARVTVAIAAIAPDLVSKTREVAVRQLAPQLSAQVVPSHVVVDIRGGRDRVADILTVIDATGLGVGRHDLPVRVEGVHDGLVRIIPTTVQVQISSVNN